MNNKSRDRTRSRVKNGAVGEGEGPRKERIGESITGCYVLFLFARSSSISASISRSVVVAGVLLTCANGSVMSHSSASGRAFAIFELPSDPPEACAVSLCFLSSFMSKSTKSRRRDAIGPSDSSLSVIIVPRTIGKPSSILVVFIRAISTLVLLRFMSTVSSRMNGSPAPKARSMAGIMTDILHTMMDTAAPTPAVKRRKKMDTR